MSINKVMMVGVLSSDPEIKQIRPGMSSCKLLISTEHTYRTKDQRESKETCVAECTVWNQEAERCQRSLFKGSMVAVIGRLKQEKWVDKTSGQERSRLVIASENITFMDKSPAREPERQEEFKFSDLELPF